MEWQDSFTYEALPARVLFGAGRMRELPMELERLGARRALVLSTPEQAPLAGRVAEMLGPLSVGTFTEAAMHTPIDVTDDALLAVLAQKADCVIGIGGGSTIGLGKAITLRTGLPQIALPTTYAGSEMTPTLGVAGEDVKTLHHSVSVLPKTVIYDAELTLSLQPLLSGASGMNAIAHAVEALYAPDRNPLVTMCAEQGISALAEALPQIAQGPDNLQARQAALYGAWLCGICFGTVSMALHHRLCQVLGGSFGLPHAETHAVLLPHTVAYNSKGAAGAMKLVRRALDAADAVDGLWQLARRLNLPRALKELGMSRESVEQAAEMTLGTPQWSPQPLEHEAVRELLLQAWEGSAPRV